MEERRESYNNNFKSCFPHTKPLDFQGVFPFVLLPYYYRTITAFFGLPFGSLFFVLDKIIFSQFSYAFFRVRRSGG